MDQIVLVNEQLEGGRRLLADLVKDGLVITAACWTQTSDDGQWYLYIVAPLVDRAGSGKAYRRLNPLLWERPNTYGVDPFEIKFIGLKEPLAQGILEHQRQHPGRPGGLFRGARLGTVGVEGAYFYSPDDIANHRTVSDSAPSPT